MNAQLNYDISELMQRYVSSKKTAITQTEIPGVFK